MQRDAMHIRYHEFIGQCLRRRWLGDPALGPARRLAGSQGWDWAKALEVAREERVRPMLHLALMDQDWVPRTAILQLHRAYYATAVRSTFLLRELESVLGRLRAASVASMVVKGVALGKSVYDNVALRSGGDLDLLVPQGQVGQVLAVLDVLGYAMIYPEMRPRDLVANKKEVALSRHTPGGEVVVDLHWRLLPDYVPEAERALGWLWETAKPLTVGHEETRMLSPEARVIYLATHCALSHHWSGMSGQLLWHTDIATLMWRQASDIEWDAVIDRAKRYGLVCPLKEVVLRLVDDWQVPIDSEAEERLQALQPSPEEARAYEFIQSDAPKRSHPAFFLRTAQQPTWRERLRYLLDYAVPKPTYMRWRYKVRWDGWLPFVYLWRGLTGARALAASAWIALRTRLRRSR